MGEVIRFVSKSERERIRLIREARDIDSVFPPADPVSEQRDKGPQLMGPVAPMLNAAKLSRD
jgi:hypothetical protein